MSLSFASDHRGTLFGTIAEITSLTEGDGDAAGFTNSGDDSIDREKLYFGWRSGRVFEGSIGRDTLEISYGQQEFSVGSGFLLMDGNFDLFGEGTYWLTPRKAFERAALLKTHTHPLRADLFYLTSDADQDLTELVGFNLEYLHSERGTLGLMYLKVLDATRINFGARDGMDLVNLRWHDLKLLAGLALSAEYVAQTGEGDDGTIDAEAWYLQASYEASQVSWQPKLSYRYASFSGSDLGATKRGDFDPLFYGYNGTWGTWYQGEITGEYLLFNSNQKTHMVHLEAHPNPSLRLGAIYYGFSLAADKYFGVPVDDKHFADELNLFVDWTINAHLSLSAVYGLAVPSAAAEQAFGDDQAFSLFEVYLYTTW